MEYIYHGVPPTLHGKNLYPLFELREKLPEVFEKEILKYGDHPKRKELPYKLIPKLGCTRGDVLHCSSIHPNLVFQALKSVFPEENRSKKFFSIPIEKIAGKQCCLFDMNHPDYVFGLEEDPPSAFELITSSTYREIRIVPPEAYRFYAEWRVRGERGAPAWGKIPHVFVNGTIDIDRLNVIDWRDPI
jgi:hypothetical protein